MSRFKLNNLAWLCVYFLDVISSSVGTENLSVNTVQEWDDPLLVVCTLNGSFYGVGQKTGYIRWKLEDEPVVKVPNESPHSLMPFFLPDPRDGSLYMLRGGEREGLKKLPFTIPQLVASSPCKSSDGILYTGKKSDAWYAVDPKTGFKEEIISFNNVQKMCPLLDSDSILVGRTEYNILMYDSKIKERKWNVTFYDYSSNTMDPQQVNSYGLVHFTASSTGHTMTLDRHLGSLSWENDFGSPVIAMYVVENNGLLSVPFTSVAEETLQHLQSRLTSQHTTASDMQLYPTLYVGEHDHGLYALLSLVDEHTPTIAPSKAGGLLLLEGPSPVTASSHWTYSFPVPGHNMRLSPQNLELPLNFHSLPRHPGGKQSSLIVLGHYSFPELSQMKVTPQITGRSDPIISPGDHVLNGSLPPKQMASVGIQTEDDEEGDALLVDGWKMLREVNITFIMSKDFLKFSYRETRLWVNQQENKGLKILLIILFGCIFSMFWYLRMQMREFQNFSQSSRGSGSGSQRHAITAMAEDVGGGQIRVGKIVFDMEQVLGKGCEGTFVYKGQFESRAVAVKRLLPECFTFADREVSLLRESDEHANVVRYFCTEQDKQFRYIALELCAATVQDYVENRFNAAGMISPTEILRQATAGLQHLHSLDIVHRDIKPHNVLISMPNAVGEVRAMISDFGLCKKLKVGRMSFSRRSGVTGTDGWIAPEMMVGNTRTTCAVDIFSLGCVIYYVMSWGKHPFGDVLRRQANILSGDSKLSDLEVPDGLLCRHLVSVMIHRDPAERPPVSAVLKHPLFWSSENVLTFLQDVSDRTEGVEEGNWVLKTLETNSSCVVREDWRYCIDTEVAQDLRKYRSYRGNSVRDLLRALRNKKHHYRELSQEAQRSLGEVPCGFVQYWTMRFPLLVLHSWLAMQCIRAEPVFAQYYQDEYVFQGTAPAATTFSTTNTSRPRSKSPVEALSWRRQDDPVRCQYLVSAPKWSSRRVAELKLESSRAHACGSDTDLSSLALLDANNMDAKLSRDCTKLNKRKGHKKKTPDVPLAWKLQSEVT